MSELDGKCDKIIEFGDDHGDNVTTFHCERRFAHDGDCEETGEMGDDVLSQRYTLTFQGREPDESDEEEAEDE